jgi:hypothetical protein
MGAAMVHDADPRIISRSGAPSRSSSEDKTAGIQYCRISWPITVAGPTRVSSAPSLAVVMASSCGGAEAGTKGRAETSTIGAIIGSG